MGRADLVESLATLGPIGGAGPDQDEGKAG
jgi:hypothetical protein